MLGFVDNLLNRITMYRLVLYYLIFLLAAAVVLSFLGTLSFAPWSIVYSALFIIIISWLVNNIFAKAFEVPANVESLYITALILALIITPPQTSASYILFLSFAPWAAVWAMASKYILAIRKKHIFNPAAFAVALTAFTINQSASWWVGTMSMAPFVLIGGILIVRKVKRFDLVWAFFITALATILIGSFLRGSDLIFTARKIFFESPILFFAFVMLTEPLTTPPTKVLQTWYGALVGFLFSPFLNIGGIYSTPELALLVGNLFSYSVSPKEKLVLKLKQKIRVAGDIYNFLFEPDRKLSFRPGQYLEWTLGHAHPDTRGNRRYFTIASSPTEENIIVGVKFYPEASSFKRNFGSMGAGDTVVAGQLAGEFVLPKDPRQKSVFIAGGIGVTPFRSMIKYLLDKNEKRSIVLIYSNKKAEDIAYVDIFSEAERRLGIKTVYTLTDPNTAPLGWKGRTGFIDGRMIQEEIPDFKERFFYLSGPHAMVTAFEKTLKGLGLKKNKIKTDFFPGFV